MSRLHKVAGAASIILFAITSSDITPAANPCDSVLKDGVFGQEFIDQSAEHKSAFEAWMCTTEFTTHAEAINAGVSVTVPVYGVPVQFGGTFSKSQRDAWKKDHCESSAGSNESASRFLAVRKMADTNIVSAWSECMRAIGRYKQGLSCAIETKDEVTSNLVVRWDTLEGDNVLPRVVGVALDGATPSSASLLPDGTQPPMASLLATRAAIQKGETTIPLRRSGGAAISVAINTTRGSCSDYSPKPQKLYDVDASVQVDAESPENVPSNFHFDDGTGSDCDNNWDRTQRYCIPGAESISGITGPAISSANCGSGAGNLHVEGNCLVIDVSIRGCGYGWPFHDCKGRGWLVFDVSGNGIRWQPAHLPPIKFQVTGQSQATWQIAYPYPIPAQYRKVAWTYSATVTRNFGGVSSTVVLSNALPAASGASSGISGQSLFVNASEM